MFTADMLVKSWTVAIKPSYYLDYVNKKNNVVHTNQVVVQ